MPKVRLTPSARVLIAYARQRFEGVPATSNMSRFPKLTQPKPSSKSDTSDTGITVGSGSSNQGALIKEVFKPMFSFSGQLSVGAGLMNLLCSSGYMMLSEGIDPGSPVTTTLGAAVTSRFSKVATLASISSLSVGDWFQIGALVTPGSPQTTDKSEVHELVAVGATNAVMQLKIVASGGTFTIAFGANTSAALAYNISSASLATAITGLASVGASNATVGTKTGSGTAADPYIWPITLAGSLAATNVELMVADGTNLTGTGTYSVVTETTPGCGASQVAFKNRLLYTYASGVAVKKVDNTKYAKHWFKHIEADMISLGGADLWSVYYRISNGTDTLEAVKYDGLSQSLNAALQTGSIPTLSSDVKFLSESYDPGVLASVSTIADPSSAIMQNTRGTFNLLGDTINAPRQVNIQLATPSFDDTAETKYEEQSNVILSHALNLSTTGKFLYSLFRLVVLGGDNIYKVSDAIPEGALAYTAQSARKINTSSEYYSFGINAPTCQLAGYDPEVNTNQPVDATLETARVINNQTTDVEEWFAFIFNGSTTDVVSPA